MTNVRHAIIADVEWMLPQLRQFSSVYGTNKSLFPTDEAYGRTLVSQMIENHIVFVAEKDGQPLGFIGGLVTPHYFNPEIKTLAEMFWWVAEDHRKSRAGLILLNAFIDWGKANTDWITVSLEKSSPVNEKSLTKRGFICAERNFLMEVS